MAVKLIFLYLFVFLHHQKEYVCGFLLEPGKCLPDIMDLCQHGVCGEDQICHCETGWTGSYCNKPVNFGTIYETTTFNHYRCGHHHCYYGRCDGHGHCNCDHGWTGTDCNYRTTTTTVDRFRCGNHHCYYGRCDGHGHCNCDLGWTGTDCNYRTTTTTADRFRCGNHHCYDGTCDNHDNCICNYGWIGKDCNERVTTTSNPYGCGDHQCFVGTCDVSGKCVCHQGWTGPDCNERKTTPATVDHSHCGNHHCYHGKCERNGFCFCEQGWTGTDCSLKNDIQSSTMRSVVQHTPTPILSITKTFACSKLSTVADIADGKISSNQNALTCLTGSKTSPEAFVLEHCNLTSPGRWKEGINIMANCNAIPPYTPIASFGNHKYSSSGTLCGIFIGCLPTGFQIGIQDCDQPPYIEHVVTNNGLFTKDPTTYYTIVE